MLVKRDYDNWLMTAPQKDDLDAVRGMLWGMVFTLGPMAVVAGVVVWLVCL
jgi:hypothetical protein